MRNHLLRGDRTGRLRTEPMRATGVPQRVGIDAQRLLKSVWWRDSSGAVFAGAQAMNAALSIALAIGLPMALYRAPLVGRLQEVIYQ